MTAYAAGRADGKHSLWKSLVWNGKNSRALDKCYLQGVEDSSIPHRLRARRRKVEPCES